MEQDSNHLATELTIAEGALRQARMALSQAEYDKFHSDTYTNQVRHGCAVQAVQKAKDRLRSARAAHARSFTIPGKILK